MLTSCTISALIPSVTHTFQIWFDEEINNGLKVTSEPPPLGGRRTACKGRIAQRSAIQAAATLSVA
ncbi:hypothetical protein J6590_082691 [Homalodisca vitripennis]|nr:hypothetical protein J6590_082691 [Homalodisca vitripennis]